MLVVSNTSPISNLALIDRLDLLRDQFERVWIPDAVQAELENIPSPIAKAVVARARREDWIRPRRAENSAMVAVLGQELDRGEAEAIALAVEMKADLLLLDERESRVAAREAGLRASEACWGFFFAPRRPAGLSPLRTKSMPCADALASSSLLLWRQRSCETPGSEERGLAR